MWVSGEARGSQEDLVLHPGAHALLERWITLKGERGAPGRDDLNLKQLRRLAPWLFILEPAADGLSYGYRLAGTALCAFLKREMTGSDFLAGWERFERGAIRGALGTVTGQLQPAHLRIRFRTDRGQKIGADVLALPMTARDGRAIHVLGGLFPHGSPEIWQYDRLVPADLAGLRLFDGRADAAAGHLVAQAPRKFRLISGGLDHP